MSEKDRNSSLIAHPSSLPPALYLVATPIGNPEDITLRALRVLREADLIVAEDTRVTRLLLDAYQIETPLTAYQQHTRGGKAAQLVERMRHGARIALVSDAGMPAVSDPGAELIRGAIAAGIRVTPIPGPTALVAALAASGLPAQRFRFLGFPPRDPEALGAFFGELAGEEETLIFYESPRRLVVVLRAIRDILGDRDAVLARDISKPCEAFLRGSLTSLLDRFSRHAPPGQYVLLVAGAYRHPEAPPPSTAESPTAAPPRSPRSR